MARELDSELLSTGKAAALCSVTPDTVLRWIKQGKLSAVRTAGGHHRVKRSELTPFLLLPPGDGPGGAAERPQPGLSAPCWEYLGEGGELREECRQCVVYRVRATRCFLLAGTTGHGRSFCAGSCEECAYYRRVQSLTARVLFITTDRDLVQRIECSERDGVWVRIARSGYEAARMVDDFRPTFAIIDIGCFSGWQTELLEPLLADPRLAGLKVILTVSPQMTRWRRRELGTGAVAGVLEKPFGCRRLAEVIRGNLEDAIDAGEAG